MFLCLVSAGFGCWCFAVGGVVGLDIGGMSGVVNLWSWGGDFKFCVVFTALGICQGTLKTPI